MNLRSYCRYQSIDPASSIDHKQETVDSNKQTQSKSQIIRRHHLIYAHSNIILRYWLQAAVRNMMSSHLCLLPTPTTLHYTQC